MSPASFREQLEPHYVRMFSAFRAANPNIINIMHSDRAVSAILDDFVEVGVEVFNPLQPNVPGHGPQELKDGWGDKLALWGGIDQQELLPKATDEELAAEIAERIRILGKDGGYMIAPAHIVQRDVSPQRVEKFVQLCIEHGKYD